MGFVARFFLLVMILSVAELYVLIYAASQLSVLATLALCILTGVVGGALVRAQGLQTLREIQKAGTRGQLPATEIISGLILLIIGTLLLTPGFITDTIAFLMLIPPLRAGVAAGLVSRFKNNIKVQHTPGGGFYASSGFPGGGPQQAPRPDPRNVIIEVPEQDIERP